MKRRYIIRLLLDIDVDDMETDEVEDVLSSAEDGLASVDLEGDIGECLETWYGVRTEAVVIEDVEDRGEA